MPARNLSMQRVFAVLLVSLGLTFASMGIASAHVNPDFESDFSGTWAVYGATPFTTNGRAKMDLKATTSGSSGLQYVRLGIQRKRAGSGAATGRAWNRYGTSMPTACGRSMSGSRISRAVTRTVSTSAHLYPAACRSQEGSVSTTSEPWTDR